MSITTFYGATAGLGLTTSIFAGNRFGDKGRFNVGPSLTVAGSLIGTTFVANSYINAKYEDLMSAELTETTQSYVEQLSDEELEKALMEFDLLEAKENENVKML